MKKSPLPRAFWLACVTVAVVLVAGLVTTTSAADANDPAPKGKGKKNNMKGRASDLVTPTAPDPTSGITAQSVAPTSKKGIIKIDAKAQSAAPQPGNGKKKKGAAGATADPSELGALRDAYNTLALADHDYMGHRHKAMHHLDQAAHLLGGDFSGDGKAGEPQKLSDAQLTAVKGSLEKLRGTIATQGRPKLLNQVDDAIKEIGIALTIR
ncbi:MAG: hypothetical protein EBS05_23965 [Proteobacteria bacterium]|nr:hypothetical protein [Pseudomonadota bacterium]